MDGFARHRLDFLPALLAIEQAPPHPLARALGAVSMLFLLVILAWAWFGQLDVVTVAPGRLIPSSRVKLIQPLEKGVVQAIHVVEGQQVKAGDALVTLDRTSTGAQKQQRLAELQQVEQRWVLDQRLLDCLTPSALRATPPVAQGEHIRLPCEAGEVSRSDGGVLSPTFQSLLQQQWQQYQAQQAALHSQRDHRVAEQQVNEAVIRKLQGTLPIVTRRAGDMKQLAQKKLLAENQYLEVEAERIVQLQDLAAAEARRIQLAAAVQESEQQLAALAAQARADTLARIADSERQRAVLREQLAQAQDVDNKQVLYAPVEGVVKDLAIHTVGGVVLEAQPLLQLVPQDGALEVEAWLANQDIGFVEAGQAAVVKVHAFPFTRYGTVPATVTQLAHDAVQAEGGQGWRFRTALQLARAQLEVEGRSVQLMPGMEVTIEILTQRRRVLDYFLAPWQQRRHESLRER